MGDRRTGWPKSVTTAFCVMAGFLVAAMWVLVRGETPQATFNGPVLLGIAVVSAVAWVLLRRRTKTLG